MDSIDQSPGPFQLQYETFLKPIRKAFRSHETCEPCILARQAVKPFKGSNDWSTGKLDVVHMDVCGPLPQETFHMGGAQYFVAFVDDHTRYSELRFPKKKSNVAAQAKAVIRKLANQTGLRIKQVKSDNGVEYVNKELNLKAPMRELASSTRGRSPIYPSTMGWQRASTGVSWRVGEPCG
jgi:hypothetical protein